MLLALVLIGCVDQGQGGPRHDTTPTGAVGTTTGVTTTAGTPAGVPGGTVAGAPTGSTTGATTGTTTIDSGSTTATGPIIAANAVPDFALPDLNPGSPRYTETVSPRDYLGQVSGWYFIHAT